MKRLDWILIFIAAAVALGLMMAVAYAHDSPAGWTYGIECCSSRDCEQMKTKVDVEPAGYFIEETGETIRYNESRLKQSQDEYFHRCYNPTNFKRTICLYRPISAY